MLYDPKWNATSIASLVAWLEKQPADKSYSYGHCGRCLLAQYFTAQGFENVLVGGSEWSHGEGLGHDCLLPEAFRDISGGLPRTFGAALERARAVDAVKEVHRLICRFLD